MGPGFGMDDGAPFLSCEEARRVESRKWDKYSNTFISTKR